MRKKERKKENLNVKKDMWKFLCKMIPDQN